MIKINKRRIIIWILVIMWAVIIFIMSNMNYEESNNKSKSAINGIVEKSVNTGHELGIMNENPNENQKRVLIEKLNKPIRKLSHASEYLILAFLVSGALAASGCKDNKKYLIGLLICFIFACTDEYHQTFVYGRTGQFSDVLIDTIGSVIGCWLLYLVLKLKYKKEKSKTDN